jgi:hypothetical protein
MKRKKASAADLATNRGKAKSSRGPHKTSDSGVGTQQEDAEFSALRKSLSAQLSPETPLQHVAFDNVVYCSWRCSLAIHLDAKSSAQCLGEQTPEGQGETGSKTDFKVSGWYGWDRDSLRAGIKFLSRCRDEFENCKRIRDEWKEDMDRGWGEEFFADLKNWEPANWTAVLLADHLQQHSARYRRPLPPIDTEAEPRVLSDPFQNKQMVSKLLNQEIRHLSALAVITNQKVAAGSGGAHGNPLGVSSHYFTFAMHDLHRAVEWFMRLRRRHL